VVAIITEGEEKRRRRKKIVYVTIKKAVGKNKITDKTDREKKKLE